MSPQTLRALCAAQAQRQTRVRAVRLEDGREWLIDPATEHFHDLDLDASASRAVRTEQAQTAEVDGDAYLVHALGPAKRLVLIGAVHIAKALAPMAAAIGFEVSIIDPRGAFTAATEFAPAQVVEDWPDEVLTRTPLDARTALVTLTHDPKLDDAALIPALSSDAFYIGCLGSRRTHQARRDRLTALGLADAQLDRLHGPAGLPIGAAGPGEIAVAILAQIVAVLRA
ncbi:MAG: XdhC family protein [Rhodothalassiaceae bacterium]